MSAKNVSAIFVNVDFSKVDRGLQGFTNAEYFFGIIFIRARKGVFSKSFTSIGITSLKKISLNIVNLCDSVYLGMDILKIRTPHCVSSKIKKNTKYLGR